MLENLYIKNFALIEELQLHFSEGLNVLTGETGAGKSIIVEALQMALGERASAEVIRAGADRAQVDALFRLPPNNDSIQQILEEHEIQTDDNTIILSRFIFSDGRSRAWISGRPVPIHVLTTLGNELVDFHGQHEHQSLLQPHRQLKLLDIYADAYLLRREIEKKYQQLQKMDKELQEWTEFQQKQSRELDLLRHELNEIEQINPQPGEDIELRNRIAYATNLETLRRNAREIAEILSGSEFSVLAQLHRVQVLLEEMKNYDEDLNTFSSRLDDVQYELQELSRECTTLANRVDISEEELEQLHQRLNQINKLKRKFGNTIEDILQYAQHAKTTLENASNCEQKIRSLEQSKQQLLSELHTLAESLADQREKYAKKLASEVTKILKELGMKNAQFHLQLERVPLSSTGINQVQFLFMPNPGEGEKPLRHIASGGELSRVMLAIKTILAQADQIPTLVFDEIDAGVGGTVARKLTTHLLELAKHHQVILITHLPHIAIAGDTHFLIEKTVVENRTITQVKPLSLEDRIKEVAKLLDGSVSEISLTHAKELLNEIQRMKGANRHG